MKFTIHEIIVFLVILLVFGLVIDGACRKNHTTNQCTLPPECQNTLQQDIHKDGPCDGKKE
jgi:hypothetical protein